MIIIEDTTTILLDWYFRINNKKDDHGKDNKFIWKVNLLH